jgi:protein SCO1/2
MKSRYWLITFAAVLTILASAWAALAHSLENLQQDLFKKEQYFQIKDEPAPDFVLEDADGKPVALRDLSGKVLVLHFVYTRCPDVCPLHAEKIADVQKMINITPMKEQVEFITITTDPENDTPEVLRSYGPVHGLDPANWMFLTKSRSDPEDTTRKLAERFGHGFDKTNDGLQMHGIVTHIIDRDGRWRGNFHGLNFGPTNLVLYVNALVNDVHRPGDSEHPQLSIFQRILSWF